LCFVAVFFEIRPYVITLCGADSSALPKTATPPIFGVPKFRDAYDFALIHLTIYIYSHDGFNVERNWCENEGPAETVCWEPSKRELD